MPDLWDECLRSCPSSFDSLRWLAVRYLCFKAVVRMTVSYPSALFGLQPSVGAFQGGLIL